MMELVTGGSGSGKSAYAEDRICALYEEYRKTGKKEQKLYYIATMYPYGTETDRKSTRLNSSHRCTSRMPSSA